ncbi:MAG TPA: translocation/assembly module TamB domain-containing protein [Casimicrobiaceae bacterium]
MRTGPKIALALVALVAVALAALVGYGLSERGLPFVVARIVAQTGGRISVEEPSGSVAGTMRFRRITWHGADATVTADDVVVEWNPGALWSRRLSIRGLGARHVDIELKPSSGATQPPTDLQLPLAVDIERLAVGRLDWHTGPRRGYVSGLEFGYAGDATQHRIRDLRFVSDFGRLEGNLRVGTREPLTVAGNGAITGDGPLAGIRVDTTIEGPIAQIGIAAKGTLRDAALSLQAIATPFAAAPFASAVAELTGVDAAAFGAALPHTRARIHFTASPRGEGLAGTLDIVNDEPGPIDAGRFPVARMSSRYAWADDTLQLAAIDATLADGGGARGDGRIVVGGAQRFAQFALTVTDLDLARVHTKLVTTRLSGRLAADASAVRQTIEGDVRDRDRSLAFAAVIANDRVDVTRFRAGTAAGSLAGSAHVTLDDANDFAIRATMQRLDPSRFAAVPGAALDGTLDASGVLRPRWRATADVRIAPTSRLAGIAVSGTAKGTVAANSIRDAKVELALGSARVQATGSAGSPGDRLVVSVDAPHVAEVAALLPAAVPRPLAGEAHASANVAIGNGGVGGDVEWRGRSLQAGPYAAATLAGHASIGAPATARGKLDERALAIDVVATRLTLGERAIDAAHVSVDGSLARHHATLALTARDIDATAALDGSLRNLEDFARAEWSGTLAAFDNRGSIAVRLRGSATLAARRDYVRLADARIDVADGHADIGELVWNDGRITTRGSFTGIPLATAARLAERPLPLDTTLVLGGEWSVAATPRLNGRFSLHRERGDVVAEVPTATTPERQRLGVTALTLAGTFTDDALDASASFASERAGTASASVAIGTASGAVPGRIDADAPLRLTARADLASLAVFQPWFGTDAAVNGRARLDIAAAGTLGRPAWSGTLRADALRLDAPQYGVSVSDGRLRAHLTGAGIALDEVRFVGGDGTFTASGLIAIPGERADHHTQVTWKAARFRATNRPDLRLVVDGDGTLAIAERRLTLRGRIDVVEGHVEYEASPTGKLAPDIVIKGEQVASRREAARDVPLALDVDVDLGRALTFAGEGIDARLAGRVRVTTSQAGTLVGRGTIRAVNGSYFAFGQKLTIDRGRLIFDGPLDNPALDVVALRKNLAVEAGVELTGTVKVPRVRITSSPPVPENEALAWLVTGQGLASGSRVDYAALSAASAALLGKRGKPFTAEIAQQFGLDDISLQRAGTSSAATGASGTSGAEGAAGQVVVFGKRISDRLSLGYEQGLSLASSALRLEYALSRQITLRAEAGVVSGVSIVYRRNFR